MATYRVTDPQSGLKVKLTGDSPPTEQELEEIFSKVGAQKPKGLLEKGLGLASRVIDIPSSIIGGSIKGSREAVTGEYKAPKLGFGINGVDLGTALPPSVVGAYRGLRDHDTVMEELPKTVGVDPNSLPGMGIGLAGEILTPDPFDFLLALKTGKKGTKVASEVIEKTVKGAGEVTKKSGEELVLRGAKVNRSQLDKFVERTHEDLSQYLARHKVTSDFYERSRELIDKYMDLFDEIALRSGKNASGQEIFESFSSRVDDLGESIIPEMKNKTGNIREVFNNLIEKYVPDLAEQIKSGNKLGDINIPVAKLTEERRAIDKLIKESSFNMPIEQATYLRYVRDALQEAIQKATVDVTADGKNIKTLGIELNKAFEFEKIASKQKQLGRGTMALGLSDFMAIAAGATGGGWPGSILALLAKRATQDPNVIGTVSSFLQKGGNKLIEKAPAVGEATAPVFDALRRASKVAIRDK